MDHPVKYLSNLTPLRGIAALLVAIFHFEMAIARFVPAARTMFFEKSYLMVDLFFVMSGFIMFHVYGENFRSAIRKTDLRKFIVARFARIYPLHLFTLLLLVFLVYVVLGPATQPASIEAPWAILTNFLLLQAYGIHHIYTWNIPSWSISAEWAAYLLFPLLALFLGRKGKAAIIVLCLSVPLAYLSIMYLLPRFNPYNPAIPVPHNINSTYDWGFLRGIAGFITGMLMYFLYRRPGWKRFFRGDMPGLLVLLFLIAALHFAVNDLLVVALFAALVLAFACNDGYIQVVCSKSLLQYLGDISYSIYLMQIFLQVPFAHGWRLPGVTGFGRGKQSIAFSSGFLYCLLYLLLLVGISSITYYAVERPCRRYINRRWG
ncbi:MAG TPA: acyltransferase [Puia sp.]|nr:acyltransferase [Puia sp.]